MRSDGTANTAPPRKYVSTAARLRRSSSPGSGLGCTSGARLSSSMRPQACASSATRSGSRHTPAPGARRAPRARLSRIDRSGRPCPRGASKFCTHGGRSPTIVRVTSPAPTPASAPEARSAPRGASMLPRWLRALSRLPWPLLYGFASCLAFLVHRVLRYRLDVVRANVRGSFPHLDARAQRHIVRGYYRRLGELAAEVVKAVTLSPRELEARVVLRNFEVLRRELESGRSVLIAAAHQCNWEWMLLALSLKLGFPLAAAYKPLHGARGERWMRQLRTRFGGALVPAKELLSHILKARGPRAIAMVAD